MATQNINTASQRNDLTVITSSPSQLNSAAPAAKDRPTTEGVPSPKGQDEDVTVQISPEAARKATVEQNTQPERVPVDRESTPQPQQPEQASSPVQDTVRTREPAAAEGLTATETATATDESSPTSEEVHSNRMEEQAERQIVNSQTIQNYANASLKTQINGGKRIDGDV